MFKLLRFIKGKDVWLTFLGFFLIMLQTVCDVAQPFLLALFLKEADKGYINGDGTSPTFWVQQDNNPIGGIWGLAGIMLALIFIALTVQAIGIVITARIGVRLGSNIRYNAFKKIQSLTFKEIDNITTPSLITRLTNDIMFYQNTVIISLRMVVRSVFLMIGGTIATFILGAQIDLWWIGGVFLGFMAIVFVSILLLLKKSVPYFRRQQKGLDQVNSKMRENLLGVRVVKAFNMQNNQIEKFDEKSLNFARVSTVANRWSASIIPVIFFVVQVSVVVIIMIIAASANTINFEITIVLQIIQLTSLVVLGIILIVTILIQLAYVKASCDRINQIFDSEPSIPRNVSNNFIENSNVKFDKVFFKYNSSEDSEYALNNISFEAKAGEMIGIIGPTGSGKTSLINLITRMYDPVKGDVYISDINVKDINYESLRNSIGVSPQKSLLFSGTIASNLKFGKEDATLEEMEEAATLSNAIEFINSKEGRFDSIVEQRGTNLSGGQKQRVSIARALIKKPKILILDDSTSALDMITEANVQNNIRKYKNTTIFLIGQRVNAISKADKIIVLESGNMVGFGTHKQLMKNCALYKEIANSQGFKEGK
ncbi:ABC transporter ATP-binding protein [Malacoplasma muris]|uniref:ABC transporter ATP-binding protein n=1 Tax=Malacoplasma muris TaxID=2119 RepID=UPI00398E3C98